VVQRRHEDRGPEADCARAGGDVGRQDEGGRPEPIARKVVFRKPGTVEPEFLTILDLLCGLPHDPVWIDTFWPGDV